MTSVLVAEGVTLLREGVGALIERDAGLRLVALASDGVQAVRMACEALPDVVVLGCRLPDMEGLEACRRLRRQAPSVRVLMVSPTPLQAQVAQCLEAGAQGCVLSSDGVGDLLTGIHALARGHLYLSPPVSTACLGHFLGLHGPAESRPPHLSPREQEVLRGIAEGLTNSEIADRLMVSIKTVQTHRGNLMQKLDLHDRVELVKYALAQGLISLEAAQNR